MRKFLVSGGVAIAAAAVSLCCGGAAANAQEVSTGHVSAQVVNHVKEATAGVLRNAQQRDVQHKISGTTQNIHSETAYKAYDSTKLKPHKHSTKSANNKTGNNRDKQPYKEARYGAKNTVQPNNSNGDKGRKHKYSNNTNSTKNC